MVNIDTQADYDSVVSELAEEFTGELADGVARNIARHLVAGVDVRNGSPIVQQAAEYECGAVEAIDHTVFPMVVLQFTRASTLSQPQQRDPRVWSLAVTALAEDLRVAHEQGVEA